ncbi:MAG: TetR/AcrR family transcriptional regulator [Bacteroidales bacterium]|nr:TetR/AcrR family transcriptional regulator [Bacteroidales bacterium]MCF8456841.1 TetR/AcrR family transcriptional regulator [Bacteroidales bacterium]
MEINEILDKVSAMYLKFGIKSVTMDDVARELLISKKTLYQYVKDKNELVEKVIDRLIEADNQQYCNILDKDRNAIEQLFDVCKHIREIITEVSTSARYDLKKYYPKQFTKLYEKKKEMMLTSVTENLEKGKQEGLFRQDFSTQYIALFFVSRIENTIEIEFFMDERITQQDFFVEVFEYHIRGLASPNGLKFFEENINELKQQ